MKQVDQAFSRIFVLVCEDFDLSHSARYTAWMSCFKVDKNGHDYLDPRVKGIYYSLAGSRPPFVPRS